MMSYLVLARKYRPQTFADVIGQEHITELLKKAITTNKTPHAYVFCGPRGIGKTSCARILAKCLNCQKAPTISPCGECTGCREITNGNSLDVLEVDGASNRGIDEIRTLRENVKFAPAFGHYKIYIIDEVHMLTMEAFNALLKTLEEPPSHVKFIFATTDPNRIPPTVLSRCQRFDFKRSPFKLIVDYLIQIGKREHLDIEQAALYSIAKASAGSFRDALGILDQVSALSDRTIKGEDVISMLGIVELDLLFELAESLSQKNCTKALEIFESIIDKGKDVKQLSKDLIEHFRNLMIIKIGGRSLGKLLDYPVDTKERYLKQSGNFTLPEILYALDLLIESQELVRLTESIRIPLEIAFAKLTMGKPLAKEGQPNLSSPAIIKSETPLPTVKQARALSPAAKFIPTEILKNQKGEVNISPLGPGKENDEAAQAVSEEVNTKEVMPVELDLEKIKRSWDALTYAVSRQKMSLATYLQEGFPLEYKEHRLTIGFSQEFQFHKESLEQNEYILLVERILSDKLKTNIVIRYQVIAQEQPPGEKHIEEEPLIKSTLETFKGKIISKWHKD